MPIEHLPTLMLDSLAGYPRWFVAACLTVVLAAGFDLDEALRRRIAGQLRAALSPRHAPDGIYQVPAVPMSLPLGWS